MALKLPYPAIRRVPYPSLHPTGRVPLTASQPPPSVARRSSVLFVAKTILVSIAVLLGITLLVEVARWIATSLQHVLTGGTLGALFLTGTTSDEAHAERARRRRVSGPRLPIPDDLGRVKPAIALTSLALLIAAFVVPATLANIFAALGLAGLLSFRVSVMQPQRRGVPVHRSATMR